MMLCKIAGNLFLGFDFFDLFLYMGNSFYKMVHYSLRMCAWRQMCIGTNLLAIT
jgi:hypothetical protein